jgi:hypothetical protein
LHYAAIDVVHDGESRPGYRQRKIRLANPTATLCHPIRIEARVPTGPFEMPGRHRLDCSWFLWRVSASVGIRGR